MRHNIFRTACLIICLLYFVLNLSVLSSNEIYSNGFEGNDHLEIKHLFSDHPVNINYIGLSNDKSLSGRSSIKFDLTIDGDDSTLSTHFWSIPMKMKIKDDFRFSYSVYLPDYLKENLNVELLPASGNYNYFTESLNNQSIQQQGWIQHNRLIFPGLQNFNNGNSFYHPTYNQSEEINNSSLQLKTKAKGRIVFFIDDLEVNRLAKDDADRLSFLDKAVSYYKTKITNLASTKGKLNESILPGSLNSELVDRMKISKKQFDDFISTSDYNSFSISSYLDSLNTLTNYYVSNLLMYNSFLKNQDSKADFFFLPPTKYNRLTGINIPTDTITLKKLSDRGVAGQYIPFSILIQARTDLKNIGITWTDFQNYSGNIPSNALDVFIAKVWYQAGYRTSENKSKILTQELLVKDDSIIKVDYKKEQNLVLVNYPDGKKDYVELTSADSKFPKNGLVVDSKKLLPFSIEKDFNKQIWFTFHIPENTKPGNYTGNISITSGNESLLTFPIEIEVLPFHLKPSILTYGIYYHGYVDDYTKKPMNYTNKTSAQYRLEMEDLKNHGVQYPTTYQILKNIDKDLQIRKEVGLPTDKLFTLGIQTGNSQDETELEKLKDNVASWKSKINGFGYKDLYVYGIDEAKGDVLRSQQKSWSSVKQAGAKVFVAGYKETYDDMGEMLDVAIIQGSLDPIQAKLYHSKGNKIFSYSNPQAGEENPEIYRRNYGLALWKDGYDGAMDYAYQKNYGSTWNDWDHKKYRDENFTYPTADGILSTVQWEGFRAAVDDVRYLSTLLNKMDEAKKKGKDVSSFEKWLNELNPDDDLDKLRSEIIDRILQLL